MFRRRFQGLAGEGAARHVPYRLRAGRLRKPRGCLVAVGGRGGLDEGVASALRLRRSEPRNPLLWFATVHGSGRFRRLLKSTPFSCFRLSFLSTVPSYHKMLTSRGTSLKAREKTSTGSDSSGAEEMCDSPRLLRHLQKHNPCARRTLDVEALSDALVTLPSMEWVRGSRVGWRIALGVHLGAHENMLILAVHVLAVTVPATSI